MNDEQFKKKLYELIEYKFKTEYTIRDNWLKNAKITKKFFFKEEYNNPFIRFFDVFEANRNNSIYNIVNKKEIKNILLKCKSFIYPKKVKPVDISKPRRSKKFNERFLIFFMETLNNIPDIKSMLNNSGLFFIRFSFNHLLPFYYVSDCFTDDELNKFIETFIKTDCLQSDNKE